MRDEGIVGLKGEALALWEQCSWLQFAPEGLSTMGRLVEVEGGEDWVLKAEVIQDEAVTSLGTSVWLEKGRDGIDLPSGALVAAKVFADSDRVVPWLTAGEASEGVESSKGSRLEAKGFLTQLPDSAQIGVGCSLVKLEEAWKLDDGWRGLLDGCCRLCDGVRVLVGAKGQALALPEDLPTTSPDSPVLVVVIGGADLDARGMGSIHGVLVVDGGSVLLEGSIVHGAVFASGEVQFGLTGQVELCGSVLRWATDRSLERVRVVPGTRQESTE
jgi:hypothetical protein